MRERPVARGSPGAAHPAGSGGVAGHLSWFTPTACAETPTQANPSRMSSLCVCVQSGSASIAARHVEPLDDNGAVELLRVDRPVDDDTRLVRSRRARRDRARRDAPPTTRRQRSRWGVRGGRPLQEVLRLLVADLRESKPFRFGGRMTPCRRSPAGAYWSGSASTTSSPSPLLRTDRLRSSRTVTDVTTLDPRCARPRIASPHW